MSLSCLSSAERRAQAILDAYGSWPECWPAEERQVTLACIARSPALQTYQKQIAELDRRIHAELAASIPAPAEVLALQQHILAALPAHTGVHSPPANNAVWQRLRHWLFTPSFATALAGVAVLAIMLWPRTLPPGGTAQTASQYQAWSWYDITGQDLPAATAPATLTMTDWIDLEVNEDGS